MPSREQELLGEAYRSGQLRVRARVLRDALALYGSANPEDFASEFDRLLLSLEPLVRSSHRESQALARGFHQTNRALEGLGRMADVPDEIVLDAERLRESLRVTGPVAWGKALRDGRAPVRAREIATVRSLGAVGRLTLEGGREYGMQIMEADPASPRYYRRTSARPCAFCAMLAARGAVYLSESSAGFQAHDHCACMPLPTYDGAATQRNERFKSQYDDAVRAAREDGTLQRGTSNDLLNAFRRAYSP